MILNSVDHNDAIKRSKCIKALKFNAKFIIDFNYLINFLVKAYVINKISTHIKIINIPVN